MFEVLLFEDLVSMRMREVERAARHRRIVCILGSRLRWFGLAGLTGWKMNNFDEILAVVDGDLALFDLLNLDSRRRWIDR
jgi:hypothetical protein